MKTSIHFHGAPRKHFPDRQLLRTCLKETASSFGFSTVFLQYIFLSDEELLEINRLYLQHDFFTDIISFNLADSSNEIEGEIYISKDRIEENAGTLGVEVDEEYCRIIAHGLLHLCGLDDKSPEKKNEMTAAENDFLLRYKHLQIQELHGRNS